MGGYERASGSGAAAEADHRGGGDALTSTLPAPAPDGDHRPAIGSAGRAGFATWLPWALWVAFAGVYSLLSLTRFNLWSTPSWDNAIFQQAISGYAHLRAPIVDIKGPGYNILGDHFSPILAVLAPIYRLFPHAQTLLIAQAVVITSSVVPIARAALSRLGAAGGTAVAMAYVLSFGIQSAVYTDFHEVAFAAPLMAFAGQAYLQRRWWAVAAWTVPLLLVKEDLGVTVAAVGFVLLFIVGARRAGAALVGTGVVGFLVVLFVLIPSFNRSGTFDYWSAVSLAPAGPGPLQTFFTGWDLKTVTLLLTFGITGFLALRSPWVLLAAPTLAWRWVGTHTEYWDTNWHYSLILMPIVFIAMIDAIGRIRAQRRSPPWLRHYADHTATVVLAIAVVLIMQFPLQNLFKAGTYRPEPADVAAATAVIALIPEGATVETNMGLITHLVDHHHVYWYATIGTLVPDYVLIDTHTGHDDLPVVDFAQRQHPGHTYRQLYDTDGYQLARRIS